MTATCIQDIIIDGVRFEEGKEYEFEETYVRYQKPNEELCYISKVYNIRTGFFSHITGYSEKAFTITFGDITLSLECNVPCFHDFFYITRDDCKTYEINIRKSN